MFAFWILLSPLCQRELIEVKEEHLIANVGQEVLLQLDCNVILEAIVGSTQEFEVGQKKDLRREEWQFTLLVLIESIFRG